MGNQKRRKCSAYLERIKKGTNIFKTSKRLVWNIRVNEIKQLFISQSFSVLTIIVLTIIFCTNHYCSLDDG